MELYTFLMAAAVLCQPDETPGAKWPGDSHFTQCVCDQLRPCNAAISSGPSPSLLAPDEALARVFAPTASPHGPAEAEHLPPL